MGPTFTATGLVNKWSFTVVPEDRKRQLDAAARAGVARWRRSNFVPPTLVLKWIDDGAHGAEGSALVNCVRDAWREMHG